VLGVSVFGHWLLASGSWQVTSSQQPANQQPETNL